MINLNFHVTTLEYVMLHVNHLKELMDFNGKDNIRE